MVVQCMYDSTCICTHYKTVDMNTIVTTIIPILTYTNPITTLHHQPFSSHPFPPTTSTQCSCKHFTKNIQSVVVKDDL